MSRLRLEMYPDTGTQHPDHMVISLYKETQELIVANLGGQAGGVAWDRAKGITEKLGLVLSVKAPKWLVRGGGDRYPGYAKHKLSLRFSVYKKELVRKNCAFPLKLETVESGHEIYPYQQTEDKAFYIDRLGYTVTDHNRPSLSPEPVKQWTPFFRCTYCNRGGHSEEESTGLVEGTAVERAGDIERQIGEIRGGMEEGRGRKEQHDRARRTVRVVEQGESRARGSSIRGSMRGEEQQQRERIKGRRTKEKRRENALTAAYCNVNRSEINTHTFLETSKHLDIVFIGEPMIFIHGTMLHSNTKSQHLITGAGGSKHKHKRNKSYKSLSEWSGYN
ncbi:hypothetical protein BGX38DRAFT_1277238 [Terfezia claveryi]|nr:hypothetical protein BGX38DRAFT_1277238 [Terfezia claveryi]